MQQLNKHVHFLVKYIKKNTLFCRNSKTRIYNLRAKVERKNLLSPQLVIKS